MSLALFGLVWRCSIKLQVSILRCPYWEMGTLCWQNLWQCWGTLPGRSRSSRNFLSPNIHYLSVSIRAVVYNKRIRKGEKGHHLGLLELTPLCLLVHITSPTTLGSPFGIIPTNCWPQVADHWYPKDSQAQARVDEYLEWQHLGTRWLSTYCHTISDFQSMVTKCLFDSGSTAPTTSSRGGWSRCRPGRWTRRRSPAHWGGVLYYSLCNVHALMNWWGFKTLLIHIFDA